MEDAIKNWDTELGKSINNLIEDREQNWKTFER